MGTKHVQCLIILSMFSRLSDGGLLVSLDGSSHTTYMKEEVGGYRIIIGNKTCVFEKDNDPTVLRLVHYEDIFSDIHFLSIEWYVSDTKLAKSTSPS